MKPYTRAIEYSYDLSPLIYRFDGKDYRQVNPNQVFASMGFSSNMIYSSAMSTDLFHVLPEHEELYREQYLLESGRWPENAEEAVLVLTRNGGVSDLSLYAMGIKDQKELDELMKAFSSGENVTIEGEIGKYSYKDFLGISFRVIDAWQRYSYDEEYKVYVDKSSDGSYMRSLLKEAPQLTIVGVVRPSEEASVAILESGISFPSELIRNMMERSAGSTIVRAQKADPDTDVITGQKFGEAGKGTLDMSTLFSIDEQAMNDAFSFDTSKLRIDASAFDMSSLDMSSLIDPNALSSAMPELDLGSLLSQVKIDLDEEELQKLFESLLQEYAEYAKADPQTDITALPDAFRSYLQSDEARALLQQDLAAFLKDSGLDQISAEDLTQLISEVMAGYPQWAMEKGYNDPEQFSTYIAEYLQLPEVQQLITAKDSELIGEIDPEVVEKAAGQIGSDLLNGYQEYASGKELPQPEKISASFGTYLQSEGAQKQISDFLQKSVDTSEVEKAVASQMSSYSDELAKQIGGGMQKMASQLADGMQKAVSSMGGSFMDAFRFDASSFSNAISMNFSEEELQELLSSLMANETSSYNGNLKLFGYADPDQPYMITIFPYDFAGKGEIKNILDAYNDDMRETDKEKVIVYTDIVGTLMSSVTDIINAIGYVLIAFVAISLVVSSIMIGVITYISVLERRKEIGILRAIGASKRNISEVFNAETFIIGLLAGVLGIVISELLLIPGNALIHHLTDADVTAYLEPSSAVILVILSVVLTLIGGLIPSRKAAHSDPVTALRTE
ncbi:MAG: ABC transporter permease [Erysipelotrichaceae bacterium]|nr:ABC transporter permease [Erysipelotrichaceae bacterium]